MSDAKKESTAEGTAEKKPKAKTNRVDREHKKSKWTMERCQKFAKRFTSVDEWKNGAPSSYKAAFSHNWVGQCSGHMKSGKTSKRVS